MSISRFKFFLLALLCLAPSLVMSVALGAPNPQPALSIHGLVVGMDEATVYKEVGKPEEIQKRRGGTALLYKWGRVSVDKNLKVVVVAGSPLRIGDSEFRPGEDKDRLTKEFIRLGSGAPQTLTEDDLRYDFRERPVFVRLKNGKVAGFSITAR